MQTHKKHTKHNGQKKPHLQVGRAPREVRRRLLELRPERRAERAALLRAARLLVARLERREVERAAVGAGGAGALASAVAAAALATAASAAVDVHCVAAAAVLLLLLLLPAAAAAAATTTTRCTAASAAGRLEARQLDLLDGGLLEHIRALRRRDLERRLGGGGGGAQLRGVALKRGGLFEGVGRSGFGQLLSFCLSQAAVPRSSSIHSPSIALKTLAAPTRPCSSTPLPPSHLGLDLGRLALERVRLALQVVRLLGQRRDRGVDVGAGGRELGLLGLFCCWVVIG